MTKKIILLSALGILLGLIFFLLYIINRIGTPAGSSTTNQQFVISEGQSSSEIATNLSEQGLIKSRLAFLVYIKVKNNYLRTGEYDLNPSLSLKSITDILSTGQIKTLKVTIPEGWRLEQIAQKLEDTKISTYEDFIIAAKGQEGYLFPDTYEFKANVTAEEIVKKMNSNFEIRTVDLKLTPDSLKLASIVEREAKLDEDRPKIAQVYLNRIKIGMKLEADPTVQYSKDTNALKKLSSTAQKDFEFWEPIYKSDYLTVDSVFNTYIKTGLPPTPICNPGLKSINGALNPIPNDYYYFVQTSDGKTYYGRNAAEHEANKRKYLK